MDPIDDSATKECALDQIGNSAAQKCSKDLIVSFAVRESSIKPTVKITAQECSLRSDPIRSSIYVSQLLMDCNSQDLSTLPSVRMSDQGDSGIEAAPQLSHSKTPKTRAPCCLINNLHSAPSAESSSRSVILPKSDLFSKYSPRMLRGGGKTALTNLAPDSFSDIAAELETQGFIIEEVLKDGNCLFRALSHQLLNDQDHHQKLRNIAVDFIQQNEKIVKDFLLPEVGDNLHSYISNMIKDGSWGGHLELYALSEALNLTISIHLAGNETITIEGPHCQEPRRVHLVFHKAMQHYDSLRRIDGTIESWPKLILTNKGTLDRRCKQNRGALLMQDAGKSSRKRKAEKPLLSEISESDNGLCSPESRETHRLLLTEGSPFKKFKYPDRSISNSPDKVVTIALSSPKVNSTHLVHSEPPTLNDPPSHSLKAHDGKASVPKVETAPMSFSSNPGPLCSNSYVCEESPNSAFVTSVGQGNHTGKDLDLMSEKPLLKQSAKPMEASKEINRLMAINNDLSLELEEKKREIRLLQEERSQMRVRFSQVLDEKSREIAQLEEQVQLLRSQSGQEIKNKSSEIQALKEKNARLSERDRSMSQNFWCSMKDIQVRLDSLAQDKLDQVGRSNCFSSKLEDEYHSMKSTLESMNREFLQKSEGLLEELSSLRARCFSLYGPEELPFSPIGSPSNQVLQDVLDEVTQKIGSLNIGGYSEPPHIDSYGSSPNGRMEIETCETVSKVLPGPMSLEYQISKTRSSDSSTSNHSNPQKKMAKISIPWKGRIIKPTYAQLREFKGNLNSILVELGGEECPLEQRTPKKIGIHWKSRTLWVTPYQILQAQGDLSQLERILFPNKNYSFRKIFRRKETQGGLGDVTLPSRCN